MALPQRAREFNALFGRAPGVGDRRLFAASEARAVGRGGIAILAELTGIARNMIDRDLLDLRSLSALCCSRVRRPGGGGKPATETQPGLLATLEEGV